MIIVLDRTSNRFGNSQNKHSQNCRIWFAGTSASALVRTTHGARNILTIVTARIFFGKTSADRELPETFV